MRRILNIETATQVCSVALGEDGIVKDFIETDDEKSHASQLAVFIDQILKRNNLQVADLSAIAVSKGPGSYTGLRIGVSTAKGLAYAAGLPLLAVSTLQSMANGISQTQDIPKNAWLCPMIDARRMEVYAAFYDIQNRETKNVSADIIDENSYQDLLNERPVYFFGNGADKCQTTITHPNANFIENVSLSAQNMVSLADDTFQQNQFEDVAYFEPFYLKRFVATVPKKNIFA